jgi:acetate kinase
VSSAPVLVLNAGSSSLKASIVEPPDTTIARSEIDWGADASRRSSRDQGLRDALEALGIEGAADAHLGAVGHRVVHGGTRFTNASLIDDGVMEAIRAVSDLAPLHNDVALATIAAARRALPDVPHVACFDTAFHATLQAEAYRYPVPERWFADWGVRRFGFHGLSVAWATRATARLLGRDAVDLAIVVAHLGSGCSVTAVDGGRSVDTSMGMTPLEGLMMGTRSGSIDPGIATRLLLDGRLTADALADALDHASGLLGISGRTSDVRELLDAEAAGDERSALALAMFVRRAAAAIAAAATTLPRLDAIVFTGGIGSNSAPIRDRIASRLAVLGVGREGARAAVAILPVEAREDLVIASAALATVAGTGGPRSDTA